MRITGVAFSMIFGVRALPIRIRLDLFLSLIPPTPGAQRDVLHLISLPRLAWHYRASAHHGTWTE